VVLKGFVPQASWRGGPAGGTAPVACLIHRMRQDEEGTACRYGWRVWDAAGRVWGAGEDFLRVKTAKALGLDMRIRHPPWRADTTEA